MFFNPLIAFYIHVLFILSEILEENRYDTIVAVLFVVVAYYCSSIILFKVRLAVILKNIFSNL